MRITAAIVDDEPYARQRIKRLIKVDEELDLVGEVEAGEDAIKVLRLKRPEIVFLDVKMPDYNGFEVLSRLDKDYEPFVIFITAYDNYAVKAFEHNAVDYILKPFDNSRFFKALDRAKEFITLKRTSRITQQISDLINQNDHAYPDQSHQIKITEKGWDIFIDYPDIVLFEAHGNYCKIHVEKKFYLYKQTMKELDVLLSSSEFLRIHRSYILNVNHIIDVKYLGKNEYQFEMSNGYKVTSGRSYAKVIKGYLSLKISSQG